LIWEAAGDAEREKQAFGGFSNPRKMPGKSIGYPAGLACPVGCRLGELPDSVCSSCYAMGGMYTFRTVKAAQMRRFEKLLLAMYSPEAAKAWIEGLSNRIRAMTRVPYFRWHDSGDIQNEVHFTMMMEVAANTPNIHHWVPTKEVAVVTRSQVEIPDNVNIRISAPMVGQRIRVSGFTTSSVSDPQGKSNGKVVKDPGFMCPATYEHDRPERTRGKCMDCRACWERDVPNVDYELH
jgi:hypothetical protein